jgi:D-tyrosyl-tRNA(Tyr) deacylase
LKKGRIKMKLLVQRVTFAKCEIDGKIVGEIKKGFLVLVGITHSDTKETADFLAKKLINLRVFEDETGKMNLSLKSVGGELLIISQFTLYANTKDGNRPSFIDAAKPEEYDVKVEHGIFGADMKISLLNDGPVTIELEK